MTTNFKEINYLKQGNSKQKKAFETLSEHAILKRLAEYSPILVGTIPINIDIENSDLDIICCFQDKDSFKKNVIECFGKYKDFQIWENANFNPVAVVASFMTNDFEIEIFGQNRISTQQNAYRHMLIEHKLLLEKGESFRKEIIELKKSGLKTEPAFTKALGLKGENPYTELFQFE